MVHPSWDELMIVIPVHIISLYYHNVIICSAIPTAIPDMIEAWMTGITKTISTCIVLHIIHIKYVLKLFAYNKYILYHVNVLHNKQVLINIFLMGRDV